MTHKAAPKESFDSDAVVGPHGPRGVLREHTALPVWQCAIVVKSKLLEGWGLGFRMQGGSEISGLLEFDFGVFGP